MTRGDDPLPGELAHALSHFVGRDQELTEIVALLGSARLFTLTGAGGSGKTRLAAQLAIQMRQAYKDGVRWVELAGVTDPAVIPNVVAAQCGVADDGNRPVLDTLTATLGPQHLLLILDNCEHLLPVCAQLVETLLAACPKLHILTTSREALRIPGEVIWTLSPLAVPEPGARLSADEALTYDAVRLFVARAGDALPGFRLSADNTPAVVRICQLVDGLPLALELAAARLRVLSLADLADRLADADRVLADGSRTAHPRQRTLRATLDWSYALLSPAERLVFSRLAVFPGSFSLGAAEVVAPGAGVEPAAVLSVLAQLVEKSLVTVQDRQDETRYRLLEPIRQYARGRLVEDGIVQVIQRRHRDWCRALADQAATHLAGRDQQRWLDRLETEHDNLREALGWSLAHGDLVDAGQIAAGIWQFWLLRGHLHEGRRWIDQILSAMPDASPLRALLLWIAGILSRPDAVRAERRFRESVDLCRALGDRAGTARALLGLGFLAQARAAHRQAIAWFEEALPLVRASADPSMLARSLTNLALSLLDVGDLDRAATICQEGLDLYQQNDDPHGIAVAKANLGLIWQARGNARRAATLWDESLQIRRRIGDHGGTAHVLTLLAGSAFRQGAFARAVERYRESLALRQRTGERDGMAPIFEGLAAVSAAQGAPIPAIRLVAAAAALRSALGTPPQSAERDANDRLLDDLRPRLGPAALAEAWTEGQAMPLEQAIATAMAIRARERTQDSVCDEPAHQGDAAQASAATKNQSFDLTQREIDVLRLLSFGLTYAQIADALVISPRTVDAHVRAIYTKLDVHSRTAATRRALEHHLI